MYAGQLANWSGPVGEGIGVGEAGVGVGDATGGAVGTLTEAGAADSDEVPPDEQAARNAATPANAAPWRKRRRLRSGLRRWGSSAIGSPRSAPSGARAGRRPRGGVAVILALRDDEAVIRRPGQ